MAENKNGKITQVIGAVLDVKFEQDCLPDINEALKIPTRSGGTLVVEVAQHLGTLCCHGFHRRTGEGHGCNCHRGSHQCAGWREDPGTYV